MKTRPYKGILLEGPTGTGKTALARAIAGEINAPFLSIKISDIKSKWHGQSEANIKAMFDEAKEQALNSKTGFAIIYIDEVDALAPERGKDINVVTDSILNSLLAEMDGIDQQDANILVLASTNRADILDKAIKRPGRFDRIIKIDLPDEEKQKEILAHYLTKTNYEHNDDQNKKDKLIKTALTQIHTKKAKPSPAELKDIIEEATRRAIHDQNEKDQESAVVTNDIILKVIEDRLKDWEAEVNRKPTITGLEQLSSLLPFRLVMDPTTRS